MQLHFLTSINQISNVCLHRVSSDFIVYAVHSSGVKPCGKRLNKWCKWCSRRCCAHEKHVSPKYETKAFSRNWCVPYVNRTRATENATELHGKYTIKVNRRQWKLFEKKFNWKIMRGNNIVFYVYLRVIWLPSAASINLYIFPIQIISRRWIVRFDRRCFLLNNALATVHLSENAFHTHTHQHRFQYQNDDLNKIIHKQTSYRHTKHLLPIHYLRPYVQNER